MTQINVASNFKDWTPSYFMIWILIKTAMHILMFQKADIWSPLPNVINGVVGVLAGLSLLFIPETLGQTMCQTIEESEAER